MTLKIFVKDKSIRTNEHLVNATIFLNDWLKSHSFINR